MRKVSARIVCAALISALVAAGLLECTSRRAGAAATGRGPAPARNAPASTAPDATPARQIPPELRADVDPVAKGGTEFAFELYGRLRDQDGNLLFSPYSVSAALAMTWAGARGATEKDMARVLHFSLPPPRVHAAFAAMRRSLEADSTGPYRLLIANRLWGQEGHTWLGPFLAITREDYGAELKALPFSTDPEGSRHIINLWVEKKTSGRIRDLIPQGTIRPARLVLTDAVYFKGTWKAPFDTSATRPDSFRTAGGTVVAPTMSQTSRFGHASHPELEILDLPYKGGDLSMVILLPRKQDGIGELEHTLIADSLARWLGSLEQEQIAVYLPRFRFTSEFSLGDALKAMDMSSAFGAEADFSGMDGQRDLWIGAVLHKSFVEVNEEGTEAAAATAVMMVGTSIVNRPKTFRADHPFVFLIRDNVTGGVLFLGRVMDPTRT